MNNTQDMIRMFSKHTGASKIEQQLAIHDVLLACFSSEVKVLTNEILNYRRIIFEVEQRFQEIELKWDNDPAALAQADKRRTIAHNAAINAAAQLNQLCDQLNIDHLFAAETNPRPDLRRIIGEEMIAFDGALCKQLRGPSSERMDLHRWIFMFSSADQKIADRTFQSNSMMLPYFYGKKEAGEELQAEIHAFNNYAKEKTGKFIYDEDVPSLSCGFDAVDQYMIDRGRSRWYR